MIHRNMKPSDQKITKTVERTPTVRLESQMLNETFNNIPEEQEISDKDTIVYTSGSNGKPLLALIKKELDLNQVIKKFY